MCGPSFFSFFLYAHRYKNIVGFDISKEQIDISKSLFRKHGFEKARFFVSDVEKIRLPEEYADFVFVTTSLHHLSDMIDAVKEIKRILKRNHYFVAFEPNLLNPYSWYHHWTERRTGKASVNEKLQTPNKIKDTF